MKPNSAILRLVGVGTLLIVVFRSDLVVGRRRRDGRPAVCPQRQGYRSSSIIMAFFLPFFALVSLRCVRCHTNTCEWPMDAAGWGTLEGANGRHMEGVLIFDGGDTKRV
jgi:hypothetical protein